MTPSGHGPIGAARSVSGRYAFVPTPCTTQPCLPGMAYAVEAGGELYFLTLQGNWFAHEPSWSGYTPQPGDRVTVTGEVAQRVDATGAPFLCIEAASVVPGLR